MDMRRSFCTAAVLPADLTVVPGQVGDSRGRVKDMKAMRMVAGRRGWLRNLRAMSESEGPTATAWPTQYVCRPERHRRRLSLSEWFLQVEEGAREGGRRVVA